MRTFLLPLREKVARTKSVPDEGFRGTDRPRPSSGPNFAALIRATFSRKGRRVRKGSYTDAVVTPPSTTMVWPVMKLDASEPR